MECQKCRKDLPQNKIEISHDIPKYVGGKDIYGRHKLCHDCHDLYENIILSRCMILIFRKLMKTIEDRRDRMVYINLIKNSNYRMKQDCFSIALKTKWEVYNGSG